MASSFDLARALGLRPLDRVQLNSAETLTEMRHDARMGRVNAELPFWFFQRITADGLLEVMSPAGSTQHVTAAEICDVIRGEPIEVLAMPEPVFVQRLRLPLHERGAPAPKGCFAPAYLRWVRKDRWNRLDQAFVTFHDEALNRSPSFATQLWHEDRQALVMRMNRKAMPVVGPGRGNYSADHGVDAATANARYAVAAMFRCAQQGLAHCKAEICAAGAAPLSTSQINRMMDREARDLANRAHSLQTQATITATLFPSTSATA
jgi:hypothetical protein